MAAVNARGKLAAAALAVALAANAQDPFFDRRLLVRLRLVDYRVVTRFDFVLSR